MNNSAKCGTETSRDQNEGESPSRCGAWALRGRAGSGQEAELGGPGTRASHIRGSDGGRGTRGLSYVSGDAVSVLQLCLIGAHIGSWRWA